MCMTVAGVSQPATAVICVQRIHKRTDLAIIANISNRRRNGCV